MSLLPDMPDMSNFHIAPAIQPLRLPDDVLDALVDVVSGDDERSKTTMGVLLLVKGQAVSGDLCSYGEWVNVLKTKNANGEGGKQLWDSITGALDERAPGSDDDEDDDDVPRQYLHLKNVKIINGGHVITTDALRILMGEIDAWNFGSPS